MDGGAKDTVLDDDANSEKSHVIEVTLADGNILRYHLDEDQVDDSGGGLVEALQQQQQKPLTPFVTACIVAAHQRREEAEIIDMTGRDDVDDGTSRSSLTTTVATADNSDSRRSSVKPSTVLDTLSVFDYIVSEAEPDRKCAICSNVFQQRDPVYALPCFHLFHVICLRPWFYGKTRPTCPICTEAYP